MSENAGGASPEVQEACKAVRLAEAELRKARELYEKVRGHAEEHLKHVRQTTVGDLLDGTLEAVKKHPGKAMTVAAVIGLALGRLLRR